MMRRRRKKIQLNTVKELEICCAIHFVGTERVKEILILGKSRVEKFKIMVKFMVQIIGVCFWCWLLVCMGHSVASEDAVISIECDCSSTSLESVSSACCVNELPLFDGSASLVFRNIANKSSIMQLKVHSMVNFTEIPTQFIGTLENLQYLELNIGLEHLSSHRLPSKLKQLNLSDNRITSIDIDAFENLPHLEAINMQCNRITTLNDAATLSNLTKLKHLILYRNKLSILKRDTFRGAANLQSIDVAGNEIESIEDGTFDLPHLKEILMSENKLKALSDDMFRGATNLQNIDLQKNQLERIGKAFEPTIHLHQLQLSENRQLQDLNVLDLASKLPELSSLSVDATGIRSIGTAIPTATPTLTPTFTFPSPLHTFSMSQNHLTQTDFLKQLSVFTKLEKLFVDANKFTRWDESDVKNIKNYFPHIELIVTKNNVWDRRWVDSTLIPVFQANNIFCSNIKYLNTYIEGFTNSIDGQIIEGTECI